MQGAREYADLFVTGQHGRLFISSGSHARGKTFHIYVLATGETAVGNGPGNAPLYPAHVEVYGITGGNPGWTETYGWLHRGPWERDFQELVDERMRERLRKKQEEAVAAAFRKQDERDRETRILDSYEPMVKP